MYFQKVDFSFEAEITVGCDLPNHCQILNSDPQQEPTLNTETSF